MLNQLVFNILFKNKSFLNLVIGFILKKKKKKKKRFFEKDLLTYLFI